ncbi:hypothetical protein QTP88_029289 [Uroleucon formosanum]
MWLCVKSDRFYERFGLKDSYGSYQTPECGEVIVDRFGNTRVLAPLVAAIKRPNNSEDVTEEEVTGKSYNYVDIQLQLASVLSRGGKSRAAVTPLKNALAEKISGASVLVAASGSKVNMEVVDVEFTSTVEAVLAAVKSAFTISSKGDASIQAAANEITKTSMWRLKNRQQDGPIAGSGSTALRPPGALSDMALVTLKQAALAGDAHLKNTRRRNSQSSKCVACDRAGFKSGQHRPGTAACKARCAAESRRSNNRLNLNGCWAAQQILDQTATLRNINVLIMSEPYARGDGGGKTIFSLDWKASVGTTSGNGFIHDYSAPITVSRG